MKIVLFLVGILIIAALSYVLFQKQDLTGTDSLLLNLVNVLLSGGMAFYVGKHFSYEEALKRIKGEAVKALRRIVRIKESTGYLLQECQRITRDISNDFEGMQKKLLLEYVSNIMGQLAAILGNVKSSIDDWGDLIPEEVKNLRKAEADQLEAILQKERDIANLLETVTRDLQAAGDNERGKIEAAADKKAAEIDAAFTQRITQISGSSPLSSTLLTLGPTGVSGYAFSDPTLPEGTKAYPWIPKGIRKKELPAKKQEKPE